MQKKNKKMFFEKTIATTMIFVMGAGNFLSVGHSAYVYAASVNELKQLKIEGKTNVRDVDVLVRVSDGRTKGSAINLDVNSKEAYLDVTLNLATSGYINGGVLEISTDKAINFELKKLESKNDKNNNSQNIVEKVEGNKIYLNQIKKDNINENNTVNFKIPLKYSYEGNISKENISNSFIAKFSAKYVSSNGKLYDVYKEQDLVINWVEEKNNTLNADIRKYIPIVTDQKQDKGNIILQTIVELENKGDGVNLPISKLELSSIMPAVNGKFPEKITSSILDTKSINEEEELTLKEDYLNYTKEDGRLKITLENKMSEDKSYVSGKGKTRVLLTSVYTNVDNISEITKKGFRAILDVNAKETLVSSNKEKTYNFKKDLVIKDKLGELVSFDMKLDKTNISKGIFYKNIYKEVKEKVSLKNTVALNVSSTDIVKGIRVKGQAPYYDNNTNLQEKNITVSKVEVSKTEFKNILGEDGSITINSNGKKLGEISKVTKEENGKYTFQLPEKVQSLEYVTSKTVNEGDLVLNEYYEMNSTAFNMEAFKKFQTLNFEKETFVQDLDGNGKTKGELSIKKLKNILKLDNTLTEINLKTNKEELSTVVKNENVEFVIQLNNDKLTSDIYGNTYFEMILPKELTNVEIKDSNIIYGEGLKLQSIKKEKVGQNIVLKIYVTGLQKEKNNGHLTNGTNIVINTDITIFEETPTKTVEYIVKYKNELATNSANVKKGTLKLKAPTGVVVANRVKNFNNSGNEVTTIKQGNKDATLELNGSAKQAQEQIMLINNLNQELKNAVILGRIPGPNTKDLKQNTDLGSNISTILTKGITNVNGRNDFDVYYSELVNANASLDAQNGWTKNPRDLKKVRSYMIVFKRNIKPQEVLKFNLNLEIPANLDYNKKAIIANSAMYRLEGQGDKYFASFADMIRLTTGEGVELQTSLNPEYEIAKQGEELTYLFTVKNVSKTVDAKNVQSYIDIPKGTVLEKIYTPKGEIPFSRDTEGRVKFNIDDIRTNEEQKIKVVLKVTEGYTKKELELKIRTKSDQIGKINEIVGKKVAIEKKKIKVEIKSRTKNYERLTEGKELDLDIKIKNITLDDLKNYKFKIEIPENLEIVNFNRKDLKKVSNLEYELNINELKATKNEIFNLKVRTKNFDNKYSNSPYYVNVSMLSNDKKSVEKAKLTGFIVKPKVHIEQSTSKATTYIQEDEIIDYIYKIKNTGSAQSNDLKLRLNLPENATVESFKKITKDETTERDITETVTSPEDIVINPGEEQQYIYKVKIPKNEGLDKKTIQINADIVDKKNNIVTSTAKITQIVEKGAETRSLEQKVLNGELTLSKDEIRKIGIRDTEKEEEKLVRNFEISGKAWKDENKNGVFDKDETILPNIVVKLIDNKKNKIIKTTTTNQDGLYTFKEVANGEYSVMFEFEENKYKPTVFKKNDVEEEKTSKALQTVVKNKGTEKSVAISDAIKIDFASKSNEDLGLRTVDGYDLALKGKITKVSVNNKNSKVIYDKKGKVEPITNVNLNNEDKLTVEYELEVKNEGNIPAFATKIAAYLPENMTFNKADNYNWEEKNGVIYTTELENTKINPQETKIVKIKLERKPEKQKSKQLLNASFEILESKQEQGKNEVDSIPGNKAISEDDMVTLNLIVKKNFKGIIAILLSIIPAVIATVFITKRYIKENKEGGK